MARQTVRTPVRLYDVDPLTGIRFLVAPAGHEVPLGVYRRLTKSASYAADPAPDPATEDAPSRPDWAALSRGRLMVEARSRGLQFTNRATKAELVDLIERAES